LVPAGYEGYVPPVSTPIGAFGFAVLIYAASFIPVIRTIMGIADRYFESHAHSVVNLPFVGPVRATEGAIGTMFLAVLIGINLFQVALNVRLNFFSRDLFNSFQDRNADAFWYQLLWVFVPLATVHVVMALVEVYLQYVLRIRWRAYTNDLFVSEWLGNSTHYRMQLTQTEADNPDQRIAEDLRKYVDTTYTLAINLLTQSATLVSFVAILWSISAGFTFPGTDYVVPGLLVWLAIAYAVLGTWLTHKIGKPLIALNFQQERYEADYRFSLARLREYTEQIALLDGEPAEKERLAGRFAGIIQNYMAIVKRYLKLQSFTLSYFQANVVVPYLITAPYFFAGKISLGQMQQTVGAFSRVESALTFFISAYTTLADYKAVIDRLTTFQLAIAQARTPAPATATLKLAQGRNPELRLRDLTVRLPDGRDLVRADDLAFRPGETTLLTGPSGSGKSTLFRAISGIWPFGHGEIMTPPGAEMMLLPQRPYIPIGTLRGAVTYPGMERTYDDTAIAEALRTARLPHLADRLDEERFWAQVLSLGEQQRLAIARALLAKPDWLLLDEATAALDEPTEDAIYRMLKEKLPDTTIVSIGHRSTLQAFHDRRIDMRPAGTGQFAPTDARAAAEAAQ
ncbi:MAG TPA: ABC transporter ATP-binding protein/permease, partial [Beijerinckiaceae bacterium]|nr:ABC transporter ATP-binding protein/permease [Beijerinckiaceae bacterium]